MQLETSTEHAVGFVRTGSVACVATRAPHRLAATGGWQEQTVSVPAGTWREELTGRHFDGGNVRCADLLADLPVALLRKR